MELPRLEYEDIQLLASDACPSVLIVKPDTLGDYVLFSGLVSELREKYRSARLTLLCAPATGELAGRHPAWDAVIVWDRLQAVLHPFYDRTVFQPLLSARWHTVLYPVTSRETRFDRLVDAIDAQYKIGVEGDELYQTEEEIKAGNLAFSRLLVSPVTHRSEYDRTVAIGKELGLRIYDRLPIDIRIHSSDHEAAARALASEKEKPVILFPGAGAARTSWGAKNYVRLIDHLHSRSSNPVWMCGPQTDGPIAEAVERKSRKRCPVRNCCGKFSIPILTALLAQAELVVGGESGPMHVAAAVGTDNLVITGGGYPHPFVPWSPTTRVARSRMKCTECGYFCKHGPQRCLGELTAEEVIDVLNETVTEKSLVE